MTRAGVARSKTGTICQVVSSSRSHGDLVGMRSPGRRVSGRKVTRPLDMTPSQWASYCRSRCRKAMNQIFSLERRSRWAEPGLKGETERRGGSSPCSSSRLGIWESPHLSFGPRGVSSPCLLVHFGTASLNRVGRSGDARRQHLRLRPVELTCLVLLGCGTKGGTSPCAGPET